MLKLDWKKVIGWLRRPSAGALGVMPCGQSVFMAFLAQDGSGEMALAWQDMLSLQEGEGLDELIERACMRAKQNIPENITCHVALDGQEVFYYEKAFPQMEASEMKQAAQLDFAAVSAWQEDYVWSYEVSSDAALRLGGILREDLAEKLDIWQNFFPYVEAVLFCQDDAKHRGEAEKLLAHKDLPIGMVGAIYGAVAGVEKRGIRLPLGKDFWHRWHWLRGAAALWGVSFLAASMLGLWWWHCDSCLQQEIRQQQEQLVLMGDIAERKAAIDADKDVIGRKNKIMEKLHGDSAVGQGLLVNIGRSMKEGIWLTELSAQPEHKVILQGKAVGYSQISSLMNELQSEEGFFHGKISLSSTEAGKDGLINFQMNGKL